MVNVLDLLVYFFETQPTDEEPSKLERGWISRQSVGQAVSLKMISHKYALTVKNRDKWSF